MGDDHIGVKINGVLYVKLEDARRLREGWDKADERIEAQAAEITRLRAELATARREGMEEAAQRLDELHKNHGYNSRTGKVHHGGKLVECPLTIEHSIGYYRALTEGTAHIRAAAGEMK